MEKIKIIELALMQRNNVILPKHIKYNDDDLFFDGVSYYDKEKNNSILDFLAMDYNALTHLFDEVEIIEEDKKIEKLELVNNGNVNAYALLDDWGTKCALTKHSKIMVDKINEIIEVINERRL